MKPEFSCRDSRFHFFYNAGFCSLHKIFNMTQAFYQFPQVQSPQHTVLNSVLHVPDIVLYIHN